MTHPLFSIVIPTYNRAHTIGRAIFSCLMQTIRDFENIVVDDVKSTDDIGAALQWFTEANIRLLTSYKDTAAANRNGGVRHARGKYIAFLDSDDEFLPNKLEKCLSVLENQPRSAVYSQTFVDRGGKRMWVRPARGLHENEDIFEYLFLHKQWVHPSTLVLEADFARRFPFREDLVFGDDTQFAVDLWRRGIPLLMIEEPLAVYSDLGSPTQLSQSPVYYSATESRNRGFADWVESQKPYMSARVYNAYRAWFLARFVARQSPSRAIGYITQAYRTRSLSATQCASQLVQVFMPRTYRAVANFVASHAGREVPTAVAQMRAQPGVRAYVAGSATRERDFANCSY